MLDSFMMSDLAVYAVIAIIIIIFLPLTLLLMMAGDWLQKKNKDLSENISENITLLIMAYWAITLFNKNILRR